MAFMEIQMPFNQSITFGLADFAPEKTLCAEYQDIILFNALWRLFILKLI